MRIDEATLVCSERSGNGITESRLEFASLEELSTLCLSPSGGKLPDRILMRVIEDDGRSCTLALSFASVVRAPQAPASD